MLYAMVTVCLFYDMDFCGTFKLLESDAVSTQYFATRDECLASLTRERRNRIAITVMEHYGFKMNGTIPPYLWGSYCISIEKEAEFDEKFKHPEGELT